MSMAGVAGRRARKGSRASMRVLREVKEWELVRAAGILLLGGEVGEG